MGMFWSERFAMALRKEFVLKALASEVPFAELCRGFGIAWKTGYKWFGAVQGAWGCFGPAGPFTRRRSRLATAASVARASASSGCSVT